MAFVGLDLISIFKCKHHYRLYVSSGRHFQLCTSSVTNFIFTREHESYNYLWLSFYLHVANQWQKGDQMINNCNFYVYLVNDKILNLLQDMAESKLAS